MLKFQHKSFTVYLVRLGDLKTLKDVISSLKPQVIHAHGIWEHVPIAWNVADKTGVKFFITAHGTWQFLYFTPGMESFRRRLKFRLYYWGKWRRMVKSATCMIALNSIEQRAFEQLGAKNVYRIPNGVDAHRFRPNTANKCSERIPFKRYLLFAGSVQKQKGIFTLLEAVKNLNKARKSWPLVIAGTGPDMDQAVNFVETHDLPVLFLGRVDRQDMPGLMSGSDLFVLPSRYEPFATVYLEAMASGTPCIGTKTGGTPEIIDHGENGFLIGPNNSDELSRILEHALEDKNLLLSMGEKARRKIIRLFDWPVLVPRLLKAYSIRN